MSESSIVSVFAENVEINEEKEVVWNSVINDTVLDHVPVSTRH